MADKIDDFQGGVKSQREHLNKVVAAVNKARADIEKLPGPGDPIVVRVTSADGLRTLLLEIGALVRGEVPGGAAGELQKFYGWRNGVFVAWLSPATDTDL